METIIRVTHQRRAEDKPDTYIFLHEPPDRLLAARTIKWGRGDYGSLDELLQELALSSPHPIRERMVVLRRDDAVPAMVDLLHREGGIGSVTLWQVKLGDRRVDPGIPDGPPDVKVQLIRGAPDAFPGEVAVALRGGWKPMGQVAVTQNGFASYYHQLFTK